MEPWWFDLLWVCGVVGFILFVLFIWSMAKVSASGDRHIDEGEDDGE